MTFFAHEIKVLCDFGAAEWQHRLQLPPRFPKRCVCMVRPLTGGSYIDGRDSKCS